MACHGCSACEPETRDPDGTGRTRVSMKRLGETEFVPVSRPTAFEELKGLTDGQIMLLGKLCAKETLPISGSLLRSLGALVERGLATRTPSFVGKYDGHITDRGREVALEYARRKQAGQCPAMRGSRGGTIVFCTKYRGHVEDGDPEHEGFRKRWTRLKYRLIERVVFHYIHTVEAETLKEAWAVVDERGDGEADVHEEVLRTKYKGFRLPSTGNE